MAERLITINIRKYLSTQPRTKRPRKAARYIRERVAHYTKLKEENVKLSYKLNELIFKKYAKSMVPVKLRVKIGTDTADVLPAEMPTDAQKAETPTSQQKKSFFSINKKESKPAAAAEATGASTPSHTNTKAQPPTQTPTPANPAPAARKPEQKKA